MQSLHVFPVFVWDFFSHKNMYVWVNWPLGVRIRVKGVCIYALRWAQADPSTPLRIDRHIIIRLTWLTSDRLYKNMCPLVLFASSDSAKSCSERSHSPCDVIFPSWRAGSSSCPCCGSEEVLKSRKNKWSKQQIGRRCDSVNSVVVSEPEAPGLNPVCECCPVDVWGSGSESPLSQFIIQVFQWKLLMFASQMPIVKSSNAFFFVLTSTTLKFSVTETK